MSRAIILLLLASCAYADMTMTEELLTAQNELNIGFEFTELYLLRQLDPWIGNLTLIVEEYVLPGFFDSRDKIFGIIDETTNYIASRDVVHEGCREDVRRRWERQVSMIGIRLQTCMQISRRIIAMEYDDINLHHPNAQRLVVHTPNQSLNILSQTSIHVPSGTIHRAINNRLRELFGRASPWLVIMDELEALFDHHVAYAKMMIVRCYSGVLADFEAEANSHRERVDMC